MNKEEILLLKPEADRIMQLSGNTRGSSIATDAHFILNKEGAEGIKKLEEVLEVLGYPFVYSQARGFEWYKEAQSVLGIFVASKIFNWTEKDLFDMGYAAPTTSVIVKIALRFVSLEKTFRQAPSVWEKHYDFGSFEPLTFDAKEKELTFLLRDYGFFEWMQHYFDGFFTRIIQLVGISAVDNFESDWFEPDNYHCRLYKVRWH